MKVLIKHPVHEPQPCMVDGKPGVVEGGDVVRENAFEVEVSEIRCWRKIGVDVQTLGLLLDKGLVSPEDLTPLLLDEHTAHTIVP